MTRIEIARAHLAADADYAARVEPARKAYEAAAATGDRAATLAAGDAYLEARRQWQDRNPVRGGCWFVPADA